MKRIRIDGCVSVILLHLFTEESPENLHYFQTNGHDKQPVSQQKSGLQDNSVDRIILNNYVELPLIAEKYHFYNGARGGNSSRIKISLALKCFWVS